MNQETPNSQTPNQEQKPEQKGSTIHLPISHNFTLFLIGLIVLGSVAYLSYTFLNLGKNYIFTNNKTLIIDNNYDTFDPDATLSDISVNQVFKDWLKSKNIGFEQVELGHFSSQDVAFNEGDNRNYCNDTQESKRFTSPSKDKEICFFSGEEPDSVLYLYEKDINTTTRIGFCGTPCMYETGFWLTPNKFVFLWTFSDMEYENKNQSYKEHMIDMYDFDLSKIWRWSTMRIY